MKRNFFIDCGGHDGCSIIKFLLKNSSFDCYTFEPNPEFHKYYRFLPTKLIKNAVHIFNGKVEFIIDTVDGDGSSIISSKIIDYKNIVKNDDCPRIIIDCIDLSEFILNNTSENDYIILKLDVEGAEYNILKKLLDDNVIDRIDELYCEFHWSKIGLDIIEHNKLLEKLNAHLEVKDWDALTFSLSNPESKHSGKLWYKLALHLKRWILLFKIKLNRFKYTIQL